MKALAILFACLATAAVSAPASALGRAASPHAVAPKPPGHHGHFGRAEIGLDEYVPDVVTAPSATDVDAPLPAPEIPAARLCPTEAAVATQSRGPRIIFIGHKPAAPAYAPKVIYGTD